MFNSSLSVCKAQDKNKCRYHTSSSQKQLQKAIDNEDYTAYAFAKQLIEEENKAEAASEFIHNAKFRNVKKMPALFVIDRVAHQATTDINENAAWIFSEPSHATIKRDGTSITVTDDGKIFARRAVKKGKTAPPGFVPAETDSYTGHTFGVEPVGQSGYAKMFTEAAEGVTLQPGTYELCGPKINGNPENLTEPKLLAHGSEEATEIPDMTTMPREEAYEKLKTIFADYKKRGIEGVVWWGSDGKRTKLRVKDFFGDPDRW
jgi:hypothetical protein